jgi:hypothetical protein
MPASLIDTAIFRDVFGAEATRRVWYDEYPESINTGQATGFQYLC